ncbi:MAG: class I SAM-dependent methyltransferase [Chloroflexi bacterium]|nr:class I SAM-dependent methyltransferase [Chloroflexota bacterium]MYF65734.1 class I SAM-dependent methyltransferase [Chloroflexota bacterium]
MEGERTMTTHQHEHRGHGEHEGLRWGHSWKEEDRVADYVERMDEQQDERQPVFDLLTRLVQAEPDAPVRILDIGTGYGPVATACLDAFPNATAVGMDVSEAMMEAGRPRMARFGERFAYMHGDFADGVLPQDVIDAGPYDLVVSARAIHHLPAELMASLYASVHGVLNPGGVFFNLDTASPETDFLRNAMRGARRRDENRPPREERRTPEQLAHDAMHHHRNATLARHLEWLHAAGFTHVECFWKNLSLALVGGYKV